MAHLGTKHCPQIAAYNQGMTFMMAFYDKKAKTFIITKVNPMMNINEEIEYTAENAYNKWMEETGTALYDSVH